MGTTEQAGHSRYVHKECGGVTIWDLSGGFCTRCHVEGLDVDDVERLEWISPATEGGQPGAPAIPDGAVEAALAADRAWHEANRGNWESVPPRQVRRLIEGAAPVLVAAERARLAAIAEHCRERMNAPGRSGMTRAAAGLILGLAEGSGEEEARDG